MTESNYTQRYVNDVVLGDEFEESQTPTPENVQAFLAPTNRGPGSANSGRFSDNAEARRIGMERAIVPGNMSAAMITRVVTDWMGPSGRVISLDVSLRRPVLQGDQLRCVAVVTDVDDEDAEATGLGVVKLDVALENDRGERPVQGTAEVELPRRA